MGLNDAGAKIDLTGQFAQVTYFNEVSGFTVARLRIDERRAPVTAVGPLLDPRPGEMLAMTGERAIRPTFGEQFRVSEFKRHVPPTVHRILKYRGSGLIRGNRTFRRHDKVMQIRNNYDMDVFNGDLGRIAARPAGA